MTGITRISKESIFSDLNNLTVVTTTSDLYADCFGFTEDEVYGALEEYGLCEQMPQVRDWYDGFVFGKQRDIYNPWSIINYLKTGILSDYWANTSSQITSNRENGFGRYDVMLEPLCDTDDAFIFEFKVHDAQKGAFAVRNRAGSITSD